MKFKSPSHKKYYEFLQSKGAMPQPKDEEDEISAPPKRMFDGGMSTNDMAGSYGNQNKPDDDSKKTLGQMIGYPGSNPPDKPKKMSYGGYANAIDEKKGMQRDPKAVANNLYAEGGVVSPSMDGYDTPYQHRYNSSGEPHTNDLKEEDQDMEYMSEGGSVEHVFAKALKRKRGY